MASTDLTPTQTSIGVDRGGPNDPTEAGSLIRRPAELVELAEQVYRGVFGAGLLVASIATGYATALGILQPPEQRMVGIAVCSLLLLGQLLATQQRRRLYPLLRRRPWLVQLPAIAIGLGAWATGADNQQLFYVLTILLGVLGAAVPLRAITLASLVAAAGMAAPHITDGSWTIGAAVAAGLLPPLFWLILDQLVRFMLRLHDPQELLPPHRPRRVRVWVERQPSAPTTPADGTAERKHDEAKDVSDSEAPENGGADLTARQLQVLLLCAEGLKHKEIGLCLEIGPVQVGRHLNNACARAQVATHAELVAWAISRGLVPPDDTAQ